MGPTHFDDARRREYEVGHLHATWSYHKISFRGVRVIGRIVKLDYWDGED